MAFRIHQFRSLYDGPRLLVLGAVHGNETCGTKALQQAINWLDTNKAFVSRGTLTMIPVTNTKAYAQGTREGDRDLNRKLVSHAAPKNHEDRVGQALLRQMAEHDVLLDLHSFRSYGEAFVMLGPRNNEHALEPFGHQHKESALAQALGPTRMIEGWLETYARYCSLARESGHAEADPDLGVGTTEAMRRLGGYGVTLECGNHLDPAAEEVAWNAFWRTLQHLGMLSAPVVAPATGNRVFDVLRLHDVLVRTHENDHLSRFWDAFETYETGALIATRHDGHEVRADSDGCIVFPSVDVAVGEEWLYLARASDRFTAQP